MILATGDLHAPIDIHKLSVSKFPEQKKMTKKDYLIVCGDFGAVWNNSKEELYWRSWLNDKNFTTLFLDGNHENHPLLNSYPEEDFCGGKVHKILPSVIHLMRGQVYNIDEKKIFIMGGAASHDKIHRVVGKSWWPEEMPSKEEYDEAIKNLERNQWKVDYVFSHCAPRSIQRQISDYYENDTLTQFLDIVKNDLKFEHWWFGHYHEDKQYGDFTAIFNVIEDVEKGV